ncbi:PilZ domain-containing protein [Aestuariivirga litoralis]|nr:PilZ domain-containing protein [Aestuariivirga litoralis]
MSSESKTQKLRAPRQRVLKTAKIVMLNDWRFYDCTIRDISAGGAKLICGEQSYIPNEFRLYTPWDHSIRSARVVWRKGNQMGIAFTSEKTETPRMKMLDGDKLSMA